MLSILASYLGCNFQYTKKNGNTLPRVGMNWKKRLPRTRTSRFCTPRSLRLPPGCKIPALANLEIRGRCISDGMHPDKKQSIDILFSRECMGKYHPGDISGNNPRRLFNIDSVKFNPPLSGKTNVFI